MSSPRFAPWLMPETIRSGSKPSIRPSVAEPHAVHRRAVAGVADRAVAEVDLLDPQRPAVVIERAVAERLPSGAITASSTSVELEQRAPQRLQALGVDPVVVGQQHAQHPGSD